jgi:hypothetical protein
MHHKAELQVLPLADAVGDNGVGFGLLVSGLGEGHDRSKAKDKGKEAFFHIGSFCWAKI